MQHIRIHNLQKHDIFCDLDLSPTDLQLIRECVKLIDHHDERVSITLTNSRPASLALMPDTAIPIVRAV
jgi:hypothetical protein